MGCFGGSSKAQHTLSDEQMAFFQNLTKMTTDMYGQFQDIAGKLRAAWQPILDKGINQLGFDPSEKATLDTAATEHVAENFQKAKIAASNAIAASGGDASNPSGAKEQLQAEMEGAAAGESSQLETQIQEADYAQGRQNYLAASGALSGVMSMENPVGMAGEATGSGRAAGDTLAAINAADSAWMGPVFGAIGGIGAGFAGGFGKSFGSKGSSDGGA